MDRHRSYSYQQPNYAFLTTSLRLTVLQMLWYIQCQDKTPIHPSSKRLELQRYLQRALAIISWRHYRGTKKRDIPHHSTCFLCIFNTLPLRDFSSGDGELRLWRRCVSFMTRPCLHLIDDKACLVKFPQSLHRLDIVFISSTTMSTGRSTKARPDAIFIAPTIASNWSTFCLHLKVQVSQLSWTQIARPPSASAMHLLRTRTSTSQG